MTEEQPQGPEPGTPEWWVGSSTVLRLPRSHWHCGLENFDWPRIHPTATKERIQTFLAEVRRGESPHLLLTGKPGIGKSHLSAGIYRWAAKHFGTQLVFWTEVPAFYERVKRSFDGGGNPWEELEDARRLVVLDDLFGRDPSQYEAPHVLYRLINQAYQSGAALVVTMNQPVTDLATRLPDHEVSRILANATVIPMRAEKDYRRSRGVRS